MGAPARTANTLGPTSGPPHRTDFVDVLEDRPCGKAHLYPAADKDLNSLSRALGELSIEHRQNIPRAKSPEPKCIKAQIEQHVPRLQRPALSANTFEPLIALDESGDKTPLAENRLKATTTTNPLPTESPASDRTLQDQVQRHLAATPIRGTGHSVSGSTSGMSWQQQNPPPYETSALKVPEVVDMVEQALSPALSGISDRSESLVGSSRTGSFSVPRIEDSLEELDRLEDQLEAVGALAKLKHVPAANDVTRSPVVNSATGSPSAQSVKSMKRASMMSLNSKSSQPSLRRSASMTLRQKNQQPGTPPTTSRGNKPSTNTTPSRSPTSKSTKPPTVAKFELPGEAVARRLKEQREARQALLEKTQKSNAAPVKPRTITKSTFELPGEAISRRKREQHEAKLRAEEEELRRKREFKARPMRNSSAPGVTPRETIASRARQAKLQEDEARAKAAAASAATLRGKRMSINHGLQTPAAPATVRKAPAPTPQVAAQRPVSSLSTTQKLARRQSTISDGVNNAKLRPKPVQDTGVKSAREQAAERSRIASREWAEKKRRQELAQKEAQRRSETASQSTVTES